MAHYAFLDENNIVTNVISGVDENVIQTNLDGTEIGGSSEGWEIFYGNLHNQVCKRTSYNNNYRKNYAIIGGTYDTVRDAFIAPKPYPSFTLNEDSCRWESPIPYPNDGNFYSWNEENQSWDEVE